MSRQLRLIDRAASAAAMSYGVKRTTVGCVIARGNRIIAVAANTSRNIPNNLTTDGPLSRHAEANALRMCDTEGADLYVVRLHANGSYGMSLPCQHCHKAIVKAGIARVFYTDWNGSIRVDRGY